MKRGTAIVAGGGVIGLACALRLVRAGISTTLVAPAHAMASASWGNAGHLALEQVEPLASGKSLWKALRYLISGNGAIRLPVGETAHWLPFFLRMAGACRGSRFCAGTEALTSCMREAAPAWRGLLEEIGHPEFLVEDGHFVVWESRRSAFRGRTSWQRASTGPARLRDATAAEMKWLGRLTRRPIHGAIRFEGTGQFTDLGALLGGLRRAIVDSGGSCMAGLATAIGHDTRGHAVLETADGARHAADALVVAAGAGSRPLLESIGLRVPLIAERGYHVQGRDDGWPAGMPPVVFEDRALIVTGFVSAVRASGFVEFARPERRPDETRWRTLEKHVNELNLPLGQPLTRWMGSRPTLPDYLPAIGKCPGVPNLYYAFGHQHLGLTMAAVTADLVRDLICETSPAMDLRPFDLRRFAGGATLAG